MGRAPEMRSISKRLLVLEGGPRGPFDDLSDGELAERINEIYAQLRPFGYDYTDINPAKPRHRGIAEDDARDDSMVAWRGSCAGPVRVTFWH